MTTRLLSLSGTVTDNELPPLTSLSELWSMKELCDKLGLRPATVHKMRVAEPQLPYLRLGAHVFFIEAQVVAFINEWQKQPDPYYVDRMRRMRAGMKVGKGRMPSHPRIKDLPRD